MCWTSLDVACDHEYMNGYELQRTRHKLGRTQEQLATAMGVSSRTISRWEAHNLPVPQSAVDRLQNLTLDDYRSLARVSSVRLLDELRTRAEMWDAQGLSSADTSGYSRLRAVASTMDESEQDEAPGRP